MKDEIEIWKDIIGYEGIYQVSNLGNVKSFHNSKINNGFVLKPSKSKKGYLIVYLSKNSIMKSIKIHRLVAIAFIENKSNKPQVNHINGNKTDNNVNNLEWVTNSENMLHAYSNGLMFFSEKRRNSLNKKVIDNKTGKIFNSAKDASNFIKMNYQTFCSQLNGSRNNNTTFKYL